MKLSKWTIYAGRALGVLILGTLMTGIFVEQSARYKAEMKYDPPGDFVDVGGHQLHYFQVGKGGPTVVFEAGLGGEHTVWAEVQPAISEQTTTVAYDRAGMLWSEQGDNPKTNEAISEELYTLLQRINAPKPYILVAHSLAGCYLRPFIRDHEEDLAGVIFVDTSHPAQGDTGSEALQDYMTPEYMPGWWIQFLDGFGFLRTILDEGKRYPDLEDSHPKNLAPVQNRFRSIQGLTAELDQLEANLEAAGQITSFGDVPLTVITGTKPSPGLERKELKEEFSQVWDDLQADQLSLSTNSRRVLAKESGHMVQIEQPELVIQAIEEMLNL